MYLHLQALPRTSEHLTTHNTLRRSSAQEQLQMSLTASYRKIPCSTLVRAYGINGNLVAKWSCQKECDLTIASLALTISIASRFNVPRQSIHLAWDAVESMPPDDNAANISIIFMANATMTLTPLHPFRDEEDDVKETCESCKDPCEDADVPWAPRKRIDNCIRCRPCFLCAACRVQIPPGEWTCFLCLEPTEVDLLNATQARRYSLALPNFDVPAPFRIVFV